MTRRPGFAHKRKVQVALSRLIRKWRFKKKRLDAINSDYEHLRAARHDLVDHFYWAVQRGDDAEADSHGRRVRSTDKKLDALRASYEAVDSVPFYKIQWAAADYHKSNGEGSRCRGPNATDDANTADNRSIPVPSDVRRRPIATRHTRPSDDTSRDDEGGKESPSKLQPRHSPEHHDSYGCTNGEHPSNAHIPNEGHGASPSHSHSSHRLVDHVSSGSPPQPIHPPGFRQFTIKPADDDFEEYADFSFGGTSRDTTTHTSRETSESAWGDGEGEPIGESRRSWKTKQERGSGNAKSSIRISIKEDGSSDACRGSGVDSGGGSAANAHEQSKGSSWVEDSQKEISEIPKNRVQRVYEMFSGD